MTRRTLALQIGLVTTIVAALSVLIAALISGSLVRAAVLDSDQARLAHDADLVASVNPQTLGAVRDRRLLRAGGVLVDLIGPAGRQSGSLSLSAADVQELLSGSPLSGRRDVDGQTLLVEGRALPDGGAVAIAEPTGLTPRTSARLRRAELVALAAGIGFGLVAGIVLARRLAKPLRAAADAAHRLASGERDVTITTDGPAEVAAVSTALNRLSQALADSEGRQQDFLLSVSHDLRTPLTTVRGYAEAIADGVTTGADVRPAAATIVAEADRLDVLVSDVLDLARLGADNPRVTLTPTDVTQVAAAAVSAWQGRCDAAGVLLRCDLPAGPVVLASDAGRLRQVLDNLLANALRVTPAGQPIVVAVRSLAPAGCTLEVRDGGPGLTDADLAVAFDRGVLSERYRGIRPVGSGLGLAIVGRIVRLLGGTASAGHAPEGGACFRVQLPG